LDAVRIPLKLYHHYAEANQADFPFYVFERELEGERQLLADWYHVPRWFRDDVFELDPDLRQTV
jgi:hypothetical protein